LKRRQQNEGKRNRSGFDRISKRFLQRSRQITWRCTGGNLPAEYIPKAVKLAEDIPVAGTNAISGSIYQPTGRINSNEFLHGGMTKNRVNAIWFCSGF
jgi:hypothetical protein